MLRLIHSQTVQGALLIDDIDDGLPNKTAHRMGSTADPKAYQRDGYANAPKQPCYISLKKPTDVTLPGYIDLNRTERVLMSAGKGKIFKMAAKGLISIVTFNAGDLAAPTVTLATLDLPGVGDITITGTNLLSVSPNLTKVVVTGTGAVTLTQTQITGGGGSISNTSIVIPAALVPGVALVTSFVSVVADDQATTPLVLT